MYQIMETYADHTTDARIDGEDHLTCCAACGELADDRHTDEHGVCPQCLDDVLEWHFDALEHDADTWDEIELRA